MHVGPTRVRGDVVVAALLLTVLIGASGCAQEAPAIGEGAARLAVTGAPAGVQVASVIVTVTSGGGPDLAAFSEPLAGADGSWRAFLTGIPAGPARRFDVVAYDATGAPRYQGAASSDVTAGEVVDVAVMLTDVPSPYVNAAPVIDALWSSRTQVPPGGDVQLGVLAHDPDAGDAIVAGWASSCGTITQPTGATVTWIAPAGVGHCDVRVTVVDTQGASVSAFVTIDVS